MTDSRGLTVSVCMSFVPEAFPNIWAWTKDGESEKHFNLTPYFSPGENFESGYETYLSHDVLIGFILMPIYTAVCYKPSDQRREISVLKFFFIEGGMLTDYLTRYIKARFIGDVLVAEVYHYEGGEWKCLWGNSAEIPNALSSQECFSLQQWGSEENQ